MSDSSLYDEYYYSHYCGHPVQRDDIWLKFFDDIAKRIIEQFNPKTVLDAGCAWGFLVEAFRNRGVEAFGVDISEYAIQKVIPEIQPFCWIGSIVATLPQKYDLITCIEVLEHLPHREAEKALENLCTHANEIIFSSTPFNYQEATHINVHEPEYWAEQFARFGFFRDIDSDLSFISAWAVRFVDTDRSITKVVREYERKSWLLQKENFDLRQSSFETQQKIKEQDNKIQLLSDKLTGSEQTVQNLIAKITEKETSNQALNALLAEKEKGLGELTSQVIKKDKAVQAFSFQVAEKERSVHSLAGQLAENQQSIISLKSQISKNEIEIKALNINLGEKENEFQILKSRLNEKENALSEIYRSKAWRLVLFFRRIRVSLLPPGSKQTNLARKVYYFFSNNLDIRKAYQIKRNLALISRSSLFDQDWYISHNQIITRLNIEPARHFLLYGGFEGHDPGPNFASKWYLDKNPDVQAARINPLVHFLKFGQKEGRVGKPGSLKSEAMGEQSAILFVSGCPGDAQRYRCVHQAELLGLRGYTSDLAIHGSVDLSQVLNRYKCFILHRVPYDTDIGQFIKRAKELGKVVLFDTDDLVFDPDAAGDIAALKIMPEEERILYFEGLGRYRKTLLDCDGVIVTTVPLAQEVASLGKPVSVLPNVVSLEMVRLAENAQSVKRKSNRKNLVIAYLSGTHTHNVDFIEAADALLWVLDTYQHIIFTVVGYLDLDERFNKYGKRINHIPLQSWQKLPEILRNVDISLAPLEKSNRFTESKSCIKYLESGLMKVPTVASRRPDFMRVINDGVNGFLADTTEEWKIALQNLIESQNLRKTIGENAYKDICLNNTTIVSAPRSEQDLRKLITTTGYKRDKRLTINWVLRAPIASRGGGYRTIFRLANYLGSRGHKVRLYIEPIAHLAGLSDQKINEFIEKNFGPLAAEVIVGHDNILPADATIATNWPTAYTVANHASTINKIYFVQDYEPEFYEKQDPEYESAERTYFLPLQSITIGQYLYKRLKQLNGQVAETISFGIDSSIFNVKKVPENRRGKTRILFFSRPGLIRRGYDLGLKALKIAKGQNPKLEIAFFGAETQELNDVPFEFVNLGVLSPEQLALEMNRSHILLSLSLSNISWVPFEGMACGLAVVEADTASLCEMVNPSAICLAIPTPEALSAAIIRLCDDENLRLKFANNAIENMKSNSWQNTCQEFETILLNKCIL